MLNMPSIFSKNSNIDAIYCNDKVHSLEINEARVSNEPDLNSEYYDNKNMLLINELSDMHNTNCDIDVTDIWVTIPLIFPMATIHDINNSGGHPYSEFSGGCLCFSPESIDVARIFSTIQGISDIGATFFQIVIAKLNGITIDNIKVVENEFSQIFSNELFINDDFISVRPVGWRKRDDYIMNSTIPFKKTINWELFEERTSFYNSILILENNLCNCNRKLSKLGTLIDSFLEKIKVISPLIDITKITDVKKDNFFEVTIRIQQMLSYISAEGEDFEIKDDLNSEFYDCKYNNNSPLVYFGDIRLINPFNFEIDNRLPCGLFKTFSLISENSVFQLSNLPVANYTPFVSSNKKRNQQYINVNSLINTRHSSQQKVNVNKNKTLSPNLSILYDKDELIIKTPPPASVFSNNSTKHCSTTSNSDLGHNSTKVIHQTAKKGTCYTPMTEQSLNKILHTPFSSTEIECSPWMNSECMASSFFSSEQELKQLIPSEISSENFINNIYTVNNDIQTFNMPLNSDLNNGNISEFNCDLSFNESFFEINNKHYQDISFAVNSSLLDCFREQKDKLINKHNKLDCMNSFKDVDILDLLENIFSDETRENVISDYKDGIYNSGYLNEYDGNADSNNFVDKINFSSEQVLNNGYKFDFWGLERFDANLSSNREKKETNVSKDSVFTPFKNSTELNTSTFF